MCGIFGALRKPHAAPIRGDVPLEAMIAVRHRGAGLGGGFARVEARGYRAPLTVRAFVDSPQRVPELRAALEARDFRFIGPGTIHKPPGGTLPLWTARTSSAPRAPRRAIDAVNLRFLEGDEVRARIYNCARHLDVWKDVAHPEDVAKAQDLAPLEGDGWLAHTREPTNSPGRYPVWSHPFASGEAAIVHNGDISSFGANMRYLRRQGYQSFTGTDSEVIAILLQHLLVERGLGIEEAARVLIDPSRGDGDPTLAGAALDGPYAVAALLGTADESHLLVLADRQKLRPLVLGEDEEAFYVASEESQIRRVSPEARVWTPEPASVFLASSKRGLVSAGRRQPRPRGVSRAPASAMPAKGERFLASGAGPGSQLVIQAPVGNCLANALSGGTVVVHGNAGDDVADTMVAGRVVIHGDARDVLGQALQGGVVLVRGSAGNRAALQMREFEDVVPSLVIGGAVDDYFGEYMAGGVAVVLNLVEGPEGLTVEDAPARATGSFVGTGMVGGTLYVRGDVPYDGIGLPPARADLAAYLETLVLDGVLDAAAAEAALREPDPDRLRETLPPDALGVLRFLEGKYHKRPQVAQRRLSRRDLERIGPALDAFFEAFRVALPERERILASRFTVISGRGGAAGEAEEG